MSREQVITFGICTYNRKDILEKSAKSLSLINNIDSVDIKIYDDCSTEFDEEYLKKLFPYAKKIVRQKKNAGADINTSLMYEDFLKSDSEWLFNADSDLIYRKDIIEHIEYYKDKCNGFMTFFNCINHKTVKKSKNFIEKDSVGAAGCLLRRDIVELILDNIKYRNTGFDVRFSKLLLRKGYKLYSTENSYVQHIGVTGFNCRNIKFDYGQNFFCDSKENAAIIETIFETYMQSVSNYRNTTSWKIYNFIVLIPRRIKKVIWIIKTVMGYER